MSGIDQQQLVAVARALKNNATWVREHLAAALYAEGTDIIRKSVRLVPVKHGILKGSHFVAPPVNRSRPVVTVGYGTDYAAYVHERNLNYTPPGQWRYLRTPMEAAVQGYPERLAKRVADYWKRGKKMAINSTIPTAPIVKPRPKGKSKAKSKSKARRRRR